jgi:hypothetical protein
MTTDRYDIRRELDRTWTVLDVFTGVAAEVGGKTVVGLQVDDAEELMNILNYEDAVRRGLPKKR